MIDFAICCVAFGDEHIDEFNQLTKSLYEIKNDLNIFVYTNNADRVNDNRVNTISSNLNWNFNLKKESIREAFKNYGTILFMDTDMFVRKNLDFSVLDNLEEDGMYLIRKPHTIFKYKQGEQISIYNMMRYTQYGKYIKTIVEPTTPMAFVEEQFFVLKLSDEKQKESFYNVWDKIYKDTEHLNCHPNHIFEEGLNIFLACVLSDIKIIHESNDIKTLYGSFVHMNFDKIIENKTTLI